MNAVLMHLHRLRHHLGLGGIGGLAAAMAGLAIYLFAVLPAEQLLQSSQDQLAKLRERPRAEAIAEPDDSASLDTFYRQFPAMTSLPDLLDTLHTAAETQQIRLDHGEFKFGSGGEGKLLSYEITLPVKGSYTHLRSFIDVIAQKLPTMGLSGISVKREAVGDGQVQAKLNFILYLSGQ